MIKRRLGSHFVLRETGGLRSGVGVERCPIHTTASRPEAGAAYFVRVGLSRDRIGANTRRSNPPAEACRGQVETSPEEMYGTGLAGEVRTKILEHSITPRQDPVETIYRIGMIGGMDIVFLKRNRVRKFVGHGMEVHVNSQLPKRVHEFPVELRSEESRV